MGALTRPAYEGVNDLMEFYKSMNVDGEYGYSVWYSLNVPAFQYWKGDAEQGEKMLEDLLTIQQEKGYKDLMYLKIHPITGKPFDKKTPIISNTPFRVTALDDDDVISGTVTPYSGGGSGLALRMLEAINGMPGKMQEVVVTKLTPLEERLKKLEEQSKVVPEVDTWDRITGLLEKPGVPEMIGAVLSRLLPGGVAAVPTPGINGINGAAEDPVKTPDPQQGENYIVDEDRLNNALDRLERVIKLDVDLELMADFAEKEPVMFNYFLKQLRGEK